MADSASDPLLRRTVRWWNSGGRVHVRDGDASSTTANGLKGLLQLGEFPQAL